MDKKIRFLAKGSFLVLLIIAFTLAKPINVSAKGKPGSGKSFTNTFGLVMVSIQGEAEQEVTSDKIMAVIKMEAPRVEGVKWVGQAGAPAKQTPNGAEVKCGGMALLKKGIAAKCKLHGLKNVETELPSVNVEIWAIGRTQGKRANRVCYESGFQIVSMQMFDSMKEAKDNKQSIQLSLTPVPCSKKHGNNNNGDGNSAPPIEGE